MRAGRTWNNHVRKMVVAQSLEPFKTVLSNVLENEQKERAKHMPF